MQEGCYAVVTLGPQVYPKSLELGWLPLSILSDVQPPTGPKAQSLPKATARAGASRGLGERRR